MALTVFGEGVWIDSGPTQILGMQLTATMTVLRLPDQSLLLHSPIAMSAERRAAIETLGAVSHLYAPNTFHHLWLGEWSSAFPKARVHAAPGLSKKRPDLRIDRTFGAETESAFAGCIDEIAIDGFRLEERALVYRPLRTLIVADLIHNVGRPQGAWTQCYARAMGFYDRVALSRMLRWTSFSSRASARRSIDELLALPFDRIVVGHGLPVLTDAKEALAAAFDWLGAAPE